MPDAATRLAEIDALIDVVQEKMLAGVFTLEYTIGGRQHKTSDLGELLERLYKLRGILNSQANASARSPFRLANPQRPRSAY